MDAGSLPEDLDGLLKYSADDMTKKLRNYDFTTGASYKMDDIIYDLYDDVVRMPLSIVLYCEISLSIQPATQRSKSALLSATIKKQGSWVRLYNRRFVVLTNNLLYYYKGKQVRSLCHYIA